MKIPSAFLLACALLVQACGNTTTTPSPASLNLAGNWTGTWAFLSGGATVTDTVTMTLTQNGTTAGGQWSASGGAAGTVSFTASADFTGTGNISQTLLSGINCSASTTLTGTASASQVRFTLGPLTPTGLCQWSASNQFTFTK